MQIAQYFCSRKNEFIICSQKYCVVTATVMRHAIVMQSLHFILMSFLILGCSRDITTQKSSPNFCGNFGYGNGFEIVKLYVKSDSTFEWREFHDLGGWRPITTGKWRASSDTVFLSTSVQPRILRVEEVVENHDSITIKFFDKNGRNILQDVPGLWDVLGLCDLKINDKQQTMPFSFDDSTSVRRILDTYISNQVVYKRTDQNRNITKIDFLFDRVPIIYTVKNPKANSFCFVLDLQIFDLWTEHLFFGHRHFFKDEPLLFWNDSYCLHHDFHCFYSPETDRSEFNINRRLTRD